MKKGLNLKKCSISEAIVQVLKTKPKSTATLQEIYLEVNKIRGTLVYDTSVRSVLYSRLEPRNTRYKKLFTRVAPGKYTLLNPE